MKKIFLLLVIASLLVMAFTPQIKLVRLTVVNKSGYTVYLSMTGKISGSHYYLTIPVQEQCASGECFVIAGTKENPLVKVFTIVADEYEVSVNYSNGESILQSGMDYLAAGQTQLTLKEPKIVGFCPYSFTEPEKCESVFVGELNKMYQYNPLDYSWYWRY